VNRDLEVTLVHRAPKAQQVCRVKLDKRVTRVPEVNRVRRECVVRLDKKGQMV
jgi:hypothetical protein